MAYLDTIKPGALRGWREEQVLASVIGAQAALESGWGTSSLSKPPHNNQFGIKASPEWTGRIINMPTREWGSGGWYVANEDFRSYDSVADSMLDHAKFFTNTAWRKENYKNVIGETDYKKACWALQNAPAPYATDPGYAQKLIDIIEQNNLQTWDREATSDQSTETVATTPTQVNRTKMVGADLTAAAREYVVNLPVTVIGDSLGVGTRPHLQPIITTANFDVLGSRQITHATPSLNGTKVLTDMKNAGILKEYVVVILGTNRGVTEQEVNNFVSIAGSERKVIFVDTASQVAHADQVSIYYTDAAKRLSNVFYVNWKLKASSHMAEYYSKDGANGEYIHMTSAGYKKHAEFIAQALYEVATGDFTERTAVTPEIDYYNIKTLELKTDGTITYDAWKINSDGTSTKYKATKQTDIKGLSSPYGDDSIYNGEANQQWGFGGSVNNSNWLESRYTDNDETDMLKLVEMASIELLDRATPDIQYTVSLMDMPDTISIGDTGVFVDHDFNPPLYIQARIISITTSQTNPMLNKVVIGNVIELQPQSKNEIFAMQEELRRTRAELKDEWINAEPVSASITTTNGYVLGDKFNETDLVARVVKAGVNVTDQYTSFKWERNSPDSASDVIYNQTLQGSTQSSVLSVTARDIIGNQSKFTARVYNAKDEMVHQTEITIKRVETALWTDTDTPPPDAKDGATWAKPDGTQWVKKDGVWEERVDQALVTAITNELEKAQDKVEEVEELADLLDQKVIEYQQKVGSDGNPQFNKNRADKQQASSAGEAVPLKHNGYGFVAGKEMTLSFKALCVPISRSDLTLNFTADDLLPLPSPITKSNMTLNLIAPGSAIPSEPVESNFKNARVVNLSDYGGSSSNADNFTALKSAINASASEPLILEIEAGTYNLQGATNDRIQMEPWESAKSKGLRLVGKGGVVFRHKHNRTVNKHEYYFMQMVFYDDSLGFEVKNITLDGIRNPQEELFYTQTESNPVPNIPLTRGFSTHGAHNVQYENVRFKNMYGGYAIQMAEYRNVSIKDVVFDKVGGNDIQESFGMAIYLGGHSGDAVINIDNAQAQGMTTDKELKLSWIGVVLENGSIQSSNPSVWMRDKNTTVNITNSSFMDYQSTFHVESMAGNVYWNVDGLTARGSNYQIVAGVYGEYKESSNNVKMDMMPYGRLWGIVHGLWYTEAQETEDNISGHNRMDMYNSVINLISLPNFPAIPQAVAYGNSVKGYLHNTQLNDVPYKLVQNGSAYLYDSVVNLSQASGETRASLQTGMFGTSEQRVELNNTTVNAFANKQNVTFGNKPDFVGNTGFVAPHISLPISPPI